MSALIPAPEASLSPVVPEAAGGLASAPALSPAGPLAGKLFLNRELSWLDFNQRVLELAADPVVPLLERVRFLGIFSSNLDEFFMKRIGGLQRQRDAGVSELSIDG